MGFECMCCGLRLGEEEAMRLEFRCPNCGFAIREVLLSDPQRLIDPALTGNYRETRED